MSTVGGLCDLLSYSNPLPQWVDNFCHELEKDNLSCDNYALTSNRFSKLGNYGKHIFVPLFTGLLGGMTGQFLFPFTVSAPVTIILSSVSSAAAEYSIQEKNGKNIDWRRVFSAGLTSLVGFGGAFLYKNKKREVPIWMRASFNAFHTTFTEFMGVLGEHRIEGKKISLTTMGEKLMNRDILGLIACSMIQGEGFHRGARLFVKTGYDEEASKFRNERKNFKPFNMDEDLELRKKIDPRITPEREIRAAVSGAFRRIQIPDSNGVVAAENRQSIGRPNGGHPGPNSIPTPVVESREISAAVNVAFRNIQTPDSNGVVAMEKQSLSPRPNGHPGPNSIPTTITEDTERTAKVSLPPRPLKEDEISSLIPKALQDEKALNLLLVHLRDRSSSLTDDHLTKIAGNLFAGLSIFNSSQARRLHTALADLPDNRGSSFLSQERLANQFAYNTFQPSLGGLNPQSRTNMHQLYQDPNQNGQIWETLNTIRAAAVTPGVESTLRITAQRERRKKMESGGNETVQSRPAITNPPDRSAIPSPVIGTEGQTIHELFADLAS